MVEPARSEKEFVIRRIARLLASHERELGRRPLILPTARFFPDRFTGDAPSLATLMRRLMTHTGTSDIPIDTELFGVSSNGGCGDGGHCKTDGGGCGDGGHCKTDGGGCGDDCQCKTDGDGCGEGCRCKTGEGRTSSGPATASGGGGGTAPSRDARGGSGCSGGSCGVSFAVDPSEPRLVERGDGWLVRVAPAELTHPVVLTTTLCLSLSTIFLVETTPKNRPPEAPIEATVELVGCLLGMGGLLLMGSHIYRKSCGGPSVWRATTLGPEAIAVGTACFVALGGHDPKPLRRELEATQKAAWDAAWRYLEERPELVRALRETPERVADGAVSFGPTPRSFWSRWFSRRSSPDHPDTPEALLDKLSAELRPKTTPATPKQHDELAELVRESLAEPPR